MVKRTVAKGCWTALRIAALWILWGPYAAPAQTLTVGNAGGQPGQTVWFNVTLDPQYVSVAGTINTIEFNPVNTPIKECQKVAGLNKTLAHALLPQACGGGGQPACRAVRVLIMDHIGQVPQAILTPTVLYQCRVDIPASATPGQYTLVMANASASDPAGNRKALSVVNGTIAVIPPGSGCAIASADRRHRGSILGFGLLVGTVLRSMVRRGQGRRRAFFALLSVGLVAGMTSRAVAQPCGGDCDGSLAVTVDEIIVAVNIALGTVAVQSCGAADANGDGTVTVDEILVAVNHALNGCPGAPTPAPTATFTPTPVVPTLTPTVDQNLAQLEVQVDNPSNTNRLVCVSGTCVNGGRQGAASHYGCPPGPTPASGCAAQCKTVSANCSGCADGRFEVRNLAPGEYLHRIEVSATNQRQFRRDLLVADPSTPNRVTWTVFKTVRIVNSAEDSGSGSLRDAVSQANGGNGESRPWLIRFDHTALGGTASIHLTSNAALKITAPGTVIDGTDAEGDPSAVADFAARTYRTVINQEPENKTLALAADIRVQGPNVVLRGLAVHRHLPSSNTGLEDKDQNVIAFDPGSQGSRIVTCRLDGGAAARTAAENQAAQGKDCVDAENTGATAANPVVIENNEIRFCYDRGIKSKSGYLRAERNWIHNNLRGGLLVQSPPPSPTPGAGIKGIIRAVDNLVEQSGVNQAQQVARAGAAEMAVEGVLARLETDGNVIRDGANHGILFRGSHSEGDIRRDYICGFNRTDGNDGKGILIEKTGGTASEVMIRETTIAYADDNGLKIEGSIAANAGSSADPGRNAFVHNGGFVNQQERTKRNFRNLTTDTPALARGNYWQRCYPSSNPNEDACNDANVSDKDTNNTTGTFDKVDSQNAQPHGARQAVQRTAILDLDMDDKPVTPTKAVQGAIVRIEGRGFNAIGGHTTTYDCSEATLKANNCDGINGTCVEFLDSVSDTWKQADILGVTPTHITVRSPIKCSHPTTIRVRRKRLSGDEIPLGLPEMETTFCTNP